MADRDDTTNMLALIEGFSVYANFDATWHILAITLNGGVQLADRIKDRAMADWMCQLLNAAIGAAQPDIQQEVADLHQIVRQLNERIAKLERG
jgi:hypothetical protein